MQADQKKNLETPIKVGSYYQHPIKHMGKDQESIPQAY
ncbi:hypothetical protein M233_10480 [Xylella fastidiosa subsp. multiplex Griffin-1]|nr:hypothetical protein M233_10480 [Xylella fastidiosa subsp. multiplex Griffin-1]